MQAATTGTPGVVITKAILDEKASECFNGVYQLDRYKKQYVNARLLLESAHTKLPKRSELADKRARTGVQTAMTRLRDRVRKRKAEEKRAKAMSMFVTGMGWIRKGLSAATLVSARSKDSGARDGNNGANDDNDNDEEEDDNDDDDDADENNTRSSLAAHSAFRPAPPSSTASIRSTEQTPLLPILRVNTTTSISSTNADVESADGSSSYHTIPLPSPRSPSSAAPPKKPLTLDKNSSFEDDFLEEADRVNEMSRLETNKVMQIENRILGTNVHDARKVKGSASFRSDLRQLYRDLNDVHQFLDANQTVLIRILSKQLVLGSRFGPRVRSELEAALSKSFEETRAVLNELIDRQEKSFAELFENGNVNVARFELMSSIGTKKHSLEAVWLCIGFSFATLVFSMVWMLVYVDHTALQRFGLVPIFRGLIYVNLFLWSILLCVWVFIRRRINYIVLLQLSARSRRFLEFKRMAWFLCIFSNYTCLNAFTCVQLLERGYVWHACVCAALTLPILIVLVAGTPMFRNLVSDSRLLVLRLLGIGPAGFAVAIMADYMTSMGKVLGDLARYFCFCLFPWEWGSTMSNTCNDSFVLNGVVVNVLLAYPLWLRLAQNLQQALQTGKRWPFLFNATKYFIAHQVVLISTLKHDELLPESKSPYRTAFVLVFVVNSLVCFLWDVFVDWGLNPFRVCAAPLRDRMMFPSKPFYYFAIVADLILRFTWTSTLVSLGGSGEAAQRKPSETTPAFGTAVNDLGIMYVPVNVVALELVRRTIWCLLRMENEHLNNTMGYREMDFVPLFFDKEVMDEEEEEDEDEDEEEVANKSRGWWQRWSRFVPSLRVFAFCVVFVLVSRWTLTL